MELPQDEFLERGGEYAQRRGLRITDRLGYGVHGTVFLTNRQAAIKVHERQSAYVQERDIYLRLREHEVSRIRSCAVPLLLNHDDELWVIEITTVSPPFVLDFAGAYLDCRPDFSLEIWEEWVTEKREQFEDDWPEVELIVASFERLGVFLTDVKPGNILLR